MNPLFSQIAIVVVIWMGVIAVTMIMSVSPVLKARRPVIFQYPRREGIIALVLSALLLMMSAGIYSALAASRVPVVANPMLPVPPEAAGFEFGWQALANQLGLLVLIAAPFVIALAVRRQPLLSVGLGKANSRGGLQLGMALALITLFLSGKVNAILNGVSLDEARYLLAMLAVGLVVETIFRGFIQMRLIGWLGELPGWIVTAAIFAVWHIPQKLMVEGLDLTGLLISLAVLFAQGLIFGWIMRKSVSVFAPGLYHAVQNWVNIL